MERILSHICLISDLGVNGNMYGGRLLALLDEAAAIYAIRTTGEPFMVTRRFSEVLFNYPVRQGQVLEFFAGNPKRGNSSITFDVKVLFDGKACFEANCTFVCVDKEGHKRSIRWENAPKHFSDEESHA